MAVEVWSKLKPKNNANFKIADPSDVEPTLDGSNSLQDDIEALSNLISSGGNSKIHVGPDEPEDKEALWKGSLDGSVKTVGSDHCPFYLEEKQFLH